jgi:3-hydroxybutyryl-CoA dehydrogenase
MSRPRILLLEKSQSFPDGDPFLSTSVDAGDVLVLLGQGAGRMLDDIDAKPYRAVVVELGSECLGVVTGEDFGREGGNVIGFARHRLGDEAPTKTIELVIQPRTDQGALSAAVAMFESAGLVVVVCRDAPGRILDRLMRPYFNRALDALDRGLAIPEVLDQALTMGLGYPRGPIALLTAAGLAHHFEVSSALHAALGEQSYLPSRRARVASVRFGRKETRS